MDTSKKGRNYFFFVLQRRQKKMFFFPFHPFSSLLISLTLLYLFFSSFPLPSSTFFLLSFNHSKKY
jgi:hypothetical protein